MVQVLILHGVAFVIGHKIGEVVGDGSPALAHTLSLQTGMQVSLPTDFMKPVLSSLSAYSVPICCSHRCSRCCWQATSSVTL